MKNLSMTQGGRRAGINGAYAQFRNQEFYSQKYKEVISFRVTNLNRKDGGSAVRSSAYLSRGRRYSMEVGRTYNFTKRKDLVHQEVILPPNAPERFRNPNCLWNEVEAVEKRKNSRLAKSLIITLPREFDHITNIKLIREYVKKYFVSSGMCSELAIHDKGDGNPHAHILLTTRSLDENGNWLSKQKGVYMTDQNGNKVKDQKTNRYKLVGTIKTNDWEAKGCLEEWRKGYADMCNEMFRQHKIDKVVTHISYERQGVDRLPTVHLGPRVKALEDRGVLTDRGNHNRAVAIENKKRVLEHTREMHIREERAIYGKRDIMGKA